jgi:hypothetical protein
MTDDDGIFVYNAAQLISCRIKIMCSALDVVNRQPGKAGVQVAVRSKGQRCKEVVFMSQPTES